MHLNTTQSQEQMWSEYRTRLYRFILRRINNPVAAEDLVQEILAKAYSQLDQLRDREKLLPWMYQATRNAIVDYYRKKKPTKEIDESLTVQNPERDDAVEKELAGCVMPFIQQLPAAYRQAILLAEMEGLTQQQVAARQGLSLSGAKSRVQRGRQMLKTMFLECCQIERDRRGGVMDFTPKTTCKNC
ncbi:MAG: RNA polymerase sigma factor SigZ [bacterium]